MRNSTWNVAAARPNAMLVTRGFITWAWRLVSVSRGRIPATVVREVSRTARKRWRAARRAASAADSPPRRWSLMNATSTMELFTTTPASEANPTMLGMERSRPRATWPQITPTSPAGITAITRIGSA